MSEYTAPLKEMQFALEAVAGLASLATLPGLEDAQPDLVAAALEEASKLASGVMAPLQRIGGSRSVSD